MRRIAFISLIFSILVLTGCPEKPPSTGAKPRIAATIFPLYDITRNIVRDEMEALVILPPGGSPHTYELSPQQAIRLQRAEVVFSIGHGLDEWVRAVADVVPDARRVVVDEGIELKPLDESHEENGHEHDDVNPHYWLSVSNAKVIAANIADEMARLDPENEASYRANLENYSRALDSLKNEIDATLQGLTTRKMIVFHNSWEYFADEFDLEIVAAFEPSPGKPPTPRHLTGLYEAARAHKIKSIFSEPQLSTDTIEQFVRDEGLKLYVLDPLGGVEGRKSYVELLRYNADTIARALSDE